MILVFIKNTKVYNKNYETFLNDHFIKVISKNIYQNTTLNIIKLYSFYKSNFIKSHRNYKLH